MDEKDNIIECSDYQGSWTVFDALDPIQFLFSIQLHNLIVFVLLLPEQLHNLQHQALLPVANYQVFHEYLRDSLNKKLLDYARDEINLEELKAAMQSLSNFPAVQQDIEVARLTSGLIFSILGSQISSSVCSG